MGVQWLSILLSCLKNEIFFIKLIFHPFERFGKASSFFNLTFQHFFFPFIMAHNQANYSWYKRVVQSRKLQQHDFSIFTLLPCCCSILTMWMDRLWVFVRAWRIILSWLTGCMCSIFFTLHCFFFSPFCWLLNLVFFIISHVVQCV